MADRIRIRGTAYPLVRLNGDGDQMEAAAIARARRVLGDGPLRVVSITQVHPDWVCYRIEQEGDR